MASCDSSKAPESDGFNFSFVKKAWKVINHDIYVIAEESWASGSLPRGNNTAFIALIPKLQGACGQKNFRLISMVGILNKIVAKLLSRRLQQVINSLISPNQSSFIKGRQILDGTLIAGKIIETYKRNRAKAIIMKLYFHKAFDSVSWGFLDWVLGPMHFPSKWREWTGSCVMSASVSI